MQELSERKIRNTNYLFQHHILQNINKEGLIEIFKQLSNATLYDSSITNKKVKLINGNLI